MIALDTKHAFLCDGRKDCRGAKGCFWEYCSRSAVTAIPDFCINDRSGAARITIEAAIVRTADTRNAGEIYPVGY